MWEVNASRDFRYAVRHSSSMVHQPCLLQVGTMLKQAGLDHLATTDERASLLDAIQAGPQSGGQQQLSLQVCCSLCICQGSRSWHLLYAKSEAAVSIRALAGYSLIGSASGLQGFADGISSKGGFNVAT